MTINLSGSGHNGRITHSLESAFVCETLKCSAIELNGDSELVLTSFEFSLMV